VVGFKAIRTKTETETNSFVVCLLSGTWHTTD